ncbi:MAG: glycosyltransferase [Proteobacteria bacterium]|nr:glycosyltransferase [Pseudomonadota bacterium]
MLGLADIIYKYFWAFIPLVKRRKINEKISELDRKALNLAPLSEVAIFSRDHKHKKKFPICQIREEAEELTIPEYSLITTCLNEEASAEGFLNSVQNLKNRPSELIIVDGGSKDKTTATINQWISSNKPSFKINLICEKKTNIAKGRNIAASNASYEYLLFTDFGCELDKNWSYRLMEVFKIKPETELVMGWYQAILKNSLQRAFSSYLIPSLETIEPESFLASARSLAIRKDKFLQLRGFPEYLTLAGEDSLFDYYSKFFCKEIAFVPDALVFWHFPLTVKSLFKTAFNYARGDSEGGKLFFEYYLKLSRPYGKILTEIIFAAVFQLINSYFQTAMFNWCVLLGLGCASIRLLLLVFRYSPFKEKGFFTFYSIKKCYAALIISLAQALGFLQGLLNTNEIEKRRIANCAQGTLLYFTAKCPQLGVDSETRSEVLKYLEAGFFVFLIYSDQIEKNNRALEHQFLESYLRLNFDADIWREKYSPLLDKIKVVDKVEDSFSREIISKLGFS